MPVTFSLSSYILILIFVSTPSLLMLPWKEYVTQDQSWANFIIEIWSSTLLVEAESIKIDHHRFWVGYPEHSQVAALVEK